MFCALEPLRLMAERGSKRAGRGAPTSAASGKEVTLVSFWFGLVLSTAGYLGRCGIFAHLILVIFLA